MTIYETKPIRSSMRRRVLPRVSSKPLKIKETVAARSLSAPFDASCKPLISLGPCALFEGSCASQKSLKNNDNRVWPCAPMYYIHNRTHPLGMVGPALAFLKSLPSP